MIFIIYGKYRKKPTKELNAQVLKLFEQMAKEGIKFIAQYWTLGRYDVTAIAEAKDEKTFMKAMIRFGDLISSETAIAVPREEAAKLLD